MGLRGLALALALAWPLPGAGLAEAVRVVAADYAEPTRRYPHAVLGDDIEWGALRLTLGCETCAADRQVTIRLPEARVFEDLAPRLVDLGGTEGVRAMVVESDLRMGARLALYGPDGLLAATPFIGRRNRWLAPVGAADLDGDGRIELAYIDRPHLAKTLRVWRWETGSLRKVASLAGLTNHRIGESDIAGGIRDCGSGPEMILADADWQRLRAVTFDGLALESRDIGPHRGRDSFAAAMAC
ncbi:MAG: VCBS repeat-containing protein [Sulfitobacter sp.]|nr:VCBS repeat-containing protein [Sulfitobacter sp.]